MREDGSATQAVTTAHGQNLLSSISGSNIPSSPLPAGITLVNDLHLAPLGYYGGPTRTMPPLPGSPAIDAGGSTTESTDQRGLPRVAGAAVDIGAVEHIPGSDAPGTLAFGSALTTLLEEAGVGLVPVLRTGGSLGSVSVTVDSAPGTASAADFDALSGLVLNFAHGETQKMVPVTVLADTLKEPTETFTLSLSNITGGAALGTPNPGLVRIIDHAPDKAKPALTLLTPKNNEIILEAAGNVVNLTGSAKDNVGIERVEVSLDGADFLPAVLSHSADFKSCTFTLPLPLTPGLRTVLVRAVDTRGLLSTTVKRSFTFRVVRPLQVTVNDNGSVTKGYAGVSLRFVGVNHTITATPARGFIFDGWLTNNALTTGLTPDMLNLPKLNFIMQEGLELTARFRENPYTTMAAGSYSGLLMPDLGLRGNDPGVDNTGFFNGTVTSKGTFSGTLLLNGGTARLTGIFDSQGHARFGKDLIRVLTLPRPGVDGQTTFEMRIDTDQAQLTGILLISKNSQNQTRSSQLTADRAFFSSKYPLEEPVTEKKGRRYNLILPARAQFGLAPNLYPQGTGIGSMFVKADGKIAFVMHLADNTKFTAASTMTLFWDCPLFAQLYGKGGLFAAQIIVDPDETDTDATGLDALWFRPAQPKATSYRAGWPDGLRMYIFGSQYIAPPAAPPMSDFPGLGAVDPANGNATLTFLDGLLPAPLAMNLNMDTTSKVTNAPASDKTFTAALTKTTGEWKGVFTHSDGKKPAWQATTFQKAGTHQGGHGFFLSVPAKSANGLAESGAVSIQAK